MAVPQIYFHPAMLSMQEEIGECEDLPHKAIHTKLLSPFAKIFNPLSFIE